MPITPYACDLRWQARSNQNAVVELGVQIHVIPLDMSGRQYVERTLRDIVNVRDYQAGAVALGDQRKNPGRNV